MDQPDREAEPQFTRPVRQIFLMLIVLLLTGVVVALALPTILPIFEANPYLNGFIFFVFVLGVVACFYQVAQLFNSVRWIGDFAGGGDAGRAPVLLAPLATLLRTRGKRMQIGATSTRSILDSVGTRIDEDREITRYIVNLLIFLGLLGTFYGLATTVPALIDTIRGMAPQEGEEGLAIFGRLMGGLEAQLSGMGVAFGSSLLGLAGSLVVGLLELFAGHGQNRFYRELEEWLSSITRLGFSGEGEGTGDQGAMVQLIDHMAEQMEGLREMHAAGEAGRQELEGQLGLLAASVERLTDRLAGTGQVHDALTRVAESQENLVDVMVNQERGEGMDAESRMRLRSIDVQLLRILEELSAGRQETMTELRTDLAALTRAVGQTRRPASTRKMWPTDKARPDAEPGQEG
ncbi:biopolymer transporter ExbB [Lutimaribacter sp. EGI FJ00015]|uniref:Biopolymer transporter ExbB n=1 Tax=Lutimaribacter degradans TaxID=2945989 RepID=A0ACC5ZXV0_9RHOB|nr:biopolymer transporter ExbB [Lutimaribacter sp. EGI FJ00013]MCM2562655.1 biopolymer transporter ExbB [Lutimaribacter sp. EGI FJ00013]MCO0613812.1 biopolymer transporter ExbB [Lutimaribacter sp. EGI FJ00015]MCO0636705.1 biopolymer transporter ExbB [Lutimaribacter sp. EGI FJ00014]